MSTDQQQVVAGSDVIWMSSHVQIGSVPLDDLLVRAVSLACDAIPAAISGGLATFDAGGRVTAAVALGEAAWEIESVAFVAGSGPGPDAARQLRPVQVDDMLGAVDRYPVFARAALERAIVSSLSSPVTAGEAAVGVLSVYGESTGGFGDHARRVVADITTLVGALLLEADQLEGQPRRPRGRYAEGDRHLHRLT
jgi:GAF domain-containing protein